MEVVGDGALDAIHGRVLQNGTDVVDGGSAQEAVWATLGCAREDS